MFVLALALAGQGVSYAAADQTLRRGTQYWDRKWNTISYVLKQDSGRTVLVARDPETGHVTTIIKGGDRTFKPGATLDNGDARYVPMGPMLN